MISEVFSTYQRHSAHTFEQAQDAMLGVDSARPLHALGARRLLDCEYPTHRFLSALRPHVVRSRTIATTQLAHAQLAQSTPDAATATAMKVPTEATTQQARVTRML